MDPTLLLFQRLNEIVAELREKCPWDRVQTKESLRHLTLEEAYELGDAILKDDYNEIRKELGDLLLHVVFYAQLAEKEGQFSLEQVIQSLNEKLIRRHPHIYGDVVVENAAQVKENWEQIKAKEKAGKKDASALDGVPNAMPGLIQAYRMQEKAAQFGFDWPEIGQVMEKVHEEWAEFEAAETPREAEEEMGDYLFALVNYCRWKGINPDDALARTNLKFRKRFQHIERMAAAEGRSLNDLTLDEMEAHWQAAKAI